MKTAGLTLQEAKDQVARKYRWKNWKELEENVLYGVLLSAMEEAAELYRSSVVEAYETMLKNKKQITRKY